MQVLVICPCHSEYLHFKDALRHVDHSNSYTVVESGIGKVNAATCVSLNLFSPNSPRWDLVVVCGYAAGVGYAQGDLVIPMSARYHDADVPDGLVPELTNNYILAGNDACTILTGDSFVTAPLAEKLVTAYGSSIVFDMEATAVAQVCDATDTPVLVLKFISDTPLSDSNNAQTFTEFTQTHTDFSPFVYYIESIN